jgi:hypothetical protein
LFDVALEFFGEVFGEFGVLRIGSLRLGMEAAIFWVGSCRSRLSSCRRMLYSRVLGGMYRVISVVFRGHVRMNKADCLGMMVLQGKVKDDRFRMQGQEGPRGVIQLQELEGGVNES